MCLESTEYPVSKPGSGSAALTAYDFIDEDIWLSMLRAGNDMTHIYDGKAEAYMLEDILSIYILEFEKMRTAAEKLYNGIIETL